MYLVIFIDRDGQVDHDDTYNSLQAAMNAINRWFASTNGKGEAQIAYAG